MIKFFRNSFFYAGVAIQLHDFYSGIKYISDDHNHGFGAISSLCLQTPLILGNPFTPYLTRSEMLSGAFMASIFFILWSKNVPFDVAHNRSEIAYASFMLGKICISLGSLMHVVDRYLNLHAPVANGPVIRR